MNKLVELEQEYIINRFKKFNPSVIKKGRRQYIKLYYDNKCELCNKNKKIMQIHHIDKNRLNNSMRNLVLLCKECHLEIHNIERKINKLLIAI